MNGLPGSGFRQIMQHYVDQMDFTSPVIQQVGYSNEGKIYDKAALKAYFRLALQKYPDLHFELLQVLPGVGSVVLYYKSIQGKYSAGYMEWDQGRIHGQSALLKNIRDGNEIVHKHLAGQLDR